MKKLSKFKQQTPNGFTLIEIMIAMVILSVGVLGLAGLQGASLKSSNTAFMRTVATNQLYALAERIRSNSAGHNLPANGGVDAYKGKFGITTHAATCGASSVSAGGCTPLEVAINDIFIWNTENARVLPNGQGNVQRIGDALIITISWDEDNLGTSYAKTNGLPDCAPLTAGTLKCVQYRVLP